MRKLQGYDVRHVWEAILPGLKHILSKTHPDWRTEDLYAACIARRMHVFKPDLDGGDFVLLAQNVSGYTGNAYLLVVAAFSKEGDAMDEFQSEIERIARESGCKSVEFCSPRKAWERMAPRYGYAEETRVYRKVLDERR